MRAKFNMGFARLLGAGITVLIGLVLLSIITYLSSCKALGKAGVVVASVAFLLMGAILIAGMVVVIKIALRNRKKKIELSNRVNLILWGVMLPVLFGFNLIGLPFLQDCLEGREITQQSIIREICMNNGRSGTPLMASPADAAPADGFDEFTLYDDLYGSDVSIVQFHSGFLANFTFMRDFFDTAGISPTTRNWVRTCTNTQLLYATITYYPRTHAILAHKNVEIIPIEPAQ